ncbi:unnamed protein product [Amoebophrya sp. A120]|nr:unnamed protein product [Amoebophrya sp. A120]|eukprot:GSA120T00024786001.1
MIATSTTSTREQQTTSTASHALASHTAAEISTKHQTSLQNYDGRNVRHFHASSDETATPTSFKKLTAKRNEQQPQHRFFFKNGKKIHEAPPVFEGGEKEIKGEMI